LRAPLDSSSRELKSDSHNKEQLSASSQLCPQKIVVWGNNSYG
jgi:hypothetical protein